LYLFLEKKGFINKMYKDFKFSSSFNIDGRKIGKGERCFIIAEAGISHFGSKEKAYDLIDMAVNAKADAVKFQIFDIESLLVKGEIGWRDRLGPRMLTFHSFENLKKYANDRGIIFMATAHDNPSLEFISSINVPAYKIGSGELGNWEFIHKTASYGKPVIISTGMYSKNDINDMMSVISKTKNKKIAILHCVTNYPTPLNDVNLRAMDIIKEYGVIHGYSDHTVGHTVSLAAVARGAKILEKHITLDFDIPNAQDWKVSCGPDDFGLFVKKAREIEIALGLREKKISKDEYASKNWATKSIVSKVVINNGDVINRGMLDFKRPGNGIPPNKIEGVIGKCANTNIPIDTVIKKDMLA
jgi:N,N'-diacetyllegionaminate synthase